MKKSTKGAVAAAAAAVLLLGGAGSLAYWNDNVTIGGGTINSGELKLTDMDCDPGAGTTASVWTLDSEGGSTTYADGDPLVPGDVLTKICTFKIDAKGNHLTADLTVSDPDFDAASDPALASVLTTDAAYAIGATPLPTPATITSANNTNIVTATVKVTFPYDGPVSAPDPSTGADNSTNVIGGLSAVLNSITINATQVHPDVP